MTKLKYLAALIASLLVPQSAHAFQALQARLQLPNASGTESLGRGCGIDGSWCAVGAPGRDGAGAVVMYERSGSTWLRAQELVSSDGVGSAQRFGTSVGLAGSTLVVGAPGDPAGGAAYVFEYNGAAWGEVTKLVSADLAASDLLGYDVALDGDSLLLGAPFKDGGSLREGAAYVSSRVGGVWQPLVKLLPADPFLSDQFGISVDVSGERLVVGSQFDDAPASNSGSAYVFARSGGVWSQEAKLMASDAALNAQFGIAVGISGDTIACGAFGDEPHGSASGSVYLFERNVASWVEAQKLSASDGQAGDIFGNFIALDGSTLVVGAPRSVLFGKRPGAAYAYLHDGLAWGSELKLVGAEDDKLDAFGVGLAVQGTSALIGAPGEDFIGAAYLFGLLEPQGGYCFGDGLASPCPCGNESGAGLGQGCRNSSGAGARLASSGSRSVGTDDLAFEAASLPASQPALLFVGRNAVAGGAGIPFGDGLRCAGSHVVRLSLDTTDAAGTASWGPGLAPAGGWSAGDTRRFQAWYRDPNGGPCAQGFNLSNGLSIEFVN